MTDTSGNSGTPYNFDKGNSSASLAQNAGKGIKGFFLAKSKTYQTLLGHELTLHEMGVRSQFKQNEIKTQGRVESNVFKAKLNAGIKGAGELNKVAEPGTKADLSDRGVQYTTPGSKVEKVANIIETGASLVGGPAGRLAGKGLGLAARKLAGRGGQSAAKLAEIRRAAAAAAPVVEAAAGAAKKAASNKTPKPASKPAAKKPAAKPKAAPKASAPKPTAKPAPKKGRAK